MRKSSIKRIIREHNKKVFMLKTIERMIAIILLIVTIWTGFIPSMEYCGVEYADATHWFFCIPLCLWVFFAKNLVIFSEPHNEVVEAIRAKNYYVENDLVFFYEDED